MSSIILFECFLPGDPGSFPSSYYSLDIYFHGIITLMRLH